MDLSQDPQKGGQSRGAPGSASGPLKRKRASASEFFEQSKRRSRDDSYDQELESISSSSPANMRGSTSRHPRHDWRDRPEGGDDGPTDSRHSTSRNRRSPDRNLRRESNSYRDMRDRRDKDSDHVTRRSLSPDRDRYATDPHRCRTDRRDREGQDRDDRDWDDRKREQRPPKLEEPKKRRKLGTSIEDLPSRSIADELMDDTSDPPRSGRPSGTKNPSEDNVQSHRATMTEDPRDKLVGQLTKFMSDVMEQASLQTRRDSAKHALQRRISEYQKGLAIHHKFPSAAEAQKASKDRAQEEFDMLEKELIGRRRSSSMLIEEIADSVFRNKDEGSDGAKPKVQTNLKELTDKYTKLDEKFEKLRGSWASNRSDWGTTRAAQDKMGKLYTTSAKKLEEKLEALPSLDQFKAIDADLKGKIYDLMSRVDGFPSLRLELSKTTESVNGNLLKQSQEIETLKKVIDGISIPKLRDELDTAIESTNKAILKHSQDIERLQTAIDGTLGNQSLQFSRDALTESEDKLRTTMTEIQARFERVDAQIRVAESKLSDIYAALDGRLKILEDRPTSAIKYRPVAINSDQNIEPISIEQLRKEFKEIQDAGDEAIGGCLEELQRRLEELGSFYNSLKDQYGIQFDSFALDLSVVKENISLMVSQASPHEPQIKDLYSQIDLLKSQYQIQLGNIAFDLSGTKERFKDLNNRLNSLESKTRKDLESIRLGLANLDFRMNNLSTEGLAKKIMDQTETHRLHIEATLPMLDLRMQALEKQLRLEGMDHVALRREVEDVVKSLHSGRFSYHDVSAGPHNKASVPQNGSAAAETVAARPLVFEAKQSASGTNGEQWGKGSSAATVVETVDLDGDH